MAMPIKSGWQGGLCECGNAQSYGGRPTGGCGACCYACCCPSCFYGQLMEQLPADMKSSTCMCCVGNCCGSCCLHWTLTGLPSLALALVGMGYLSFGAAMCGWCATMHTRGAIRKKYDIPGSGCEDCCTAAFCECCSFVQEQREFIAREAAPSANPMQPPTAMAMAVPVPMATAVGQPMASIPCAVAQPVPPPATYF
jgi:Cys-rich protein (TIGR01571 family)